MKVKAAVVREAGAPPGSETVDPSGPHASEVPVQSKATGTCRADAYMLCGDDPAGVARDPHEDESIRAVVVH